MFDNLMSLTRIDTVWALRLSDLLCPRHVLQMVGQEQVKRSHQSPSPNYSSIAVLTQLTKQTPTGSRWLNLLAANGTETYKLMWQCFWCYKTGGYSYFLLQSINDTTKVANSNIMQPCKFVAYTYRYMIHHVVVCRLLHSHGCHCPNPTNDCQRD